MTNQADSAIVLSMGQRGFKVIDSGGTATYTGRSVAILPLEDCTVNATSDLDDNLSSQDLVQGLQLC